MTNEPQTQSEYLDHLVEIDERIVNARRASQLAMHDFRNKLMVRDGAALKFESGGHRPSLVDCLREVSATQRMVQEGLLPYGGDDSQPGPSVLDRTAHAMKGSVTVRAGGGNAFRRAIGVDGRVVKPTTLKSLPKVRQYVPPMREKLRSES